MSESVATSSTEDDDLDSTIIIAIVIGSTGFVLMMLGAVYYVTRLGDVPSRKAVASVVEEGQEQQQRQQANSKEGDEKGDGEGSEPDRNTSVREELIEVYAPTGKLGVVLEDSPTEDCPPMVHSVRDTSVLKNELHVGDRIIALDDEDVRKMTANRVSKLISRKMENTTRKLSIIRTMSMVPDV